jgi:hypothetical protein
VLDRVDVQVVAEERARLVPESFSGDVVTLDAPVRSPDGSGYTTQAEFVRRPSREPVVLFGDASAGPSRVGHVQPAEMIVVPDDTRS